MAHTITIIWTFYKRLIIPTLALSLLAGGLGAGTNMQALLYATGLSYMLFGLLCHFFIYEIRKPAEYYFYSNLGYSRPFLWLTTFVLNGLIGLAFILW